MRSTGQCGEFTRETRFGVVTETARHESRFPMTTAVTHVWADKTVLIISPQKWDHIRISKHNYAIALKDQGANVVFVQPPADGLSRSVLAATDVPGIQTLTYPRPWFYRLRFHARWLFDRLQSILIRRTLAAHSIRPDVVWCFDFNLYSDLSIFKAQKTIFHPVDPLSEAQHIRPAKTADLVLTVSEKIADQIRPSGVSVTVINHGLAKPFEELARVEHCSAEHTQSVVRVGYAGNLTRGPVNRKVIQQIVMNHPDVEFHFWGPNESGEGEIAYFISQLQSAKNVTLYGPVSQVELADGFREMDLFLLTYSADARESDRSNSHKILEYLSTVKVVVSSRIQHYTDQDDLLVMSQTEDDSDLPQLFTETLHNVAEHNSQQLSNSRIERALANTYDFHILHVSQLLATSV